MANMMLRGYPVKKTTQIPVNLGGGSDESEIYFADFADVVVGEVPGLILGVSTEASYTSGSSTVSAFQNDQTLILAIERHDMNLRHLESVGVMTGVTWGA